MAEYTAYLTVALTPAVAEAICDAAFEEEVGRSVMGRKLIEDGLVMRQLRRSAEAGAEAGALLRAKVEDDWIFLNPTERAEAIRRASGDES
ncbi:MAG: hypothetical protein WBK88_07065 [Methanothrix sp.]